jgi:hypothetical protein
VHALHLHDIWNFSVKTTSNYAIYQVNYQLIQEICNPKLDYVIQQN